MMQVASLLNGLQSILDTSINQLKYSSYMSGDRHRLTESECGIIVESLGARLKEQVDSETDLVEAQSLFRLIFRLSHSCNRGRIAFPSHETFSDMRNYLLKISNI